MNKKNQIYYDYLHKIFTSLDKFKGKELEEEFDKLLKEVRIKIALEEL